MGSKSIYLEKEFLNETFGNASKPTRSNLFFALFTTSPTESSDSGVEVTGGSYARVSVTNDSGHFAAATKTGSNPSQKTNVLDITFPAATGSWGTVLAFGIYDASTAGNLLYWGAISPSLAIGSGTTFAIPAGQLLITET